MLVYRFGIAGRDLMNTLNRHIRQSFLKPFPGVARADEKMEEPSSMEYCPYPVK